MSGTGFTKLSRVLAKTKEGDLFFECPGLRHGPWHFHRTWVWSSLELQRKC